jgi:hypothetical protein
MQDHLVAVTGGPAIEICTQRALGQEAERIRTTLGRRHLVRDSVARGAIRGFPEHAVGGCLERALDHSTDLGRQPATQDHHPIIVDVHRHRPVQMALFGLLRRLGLVHPPPGADDTLYLRRRGGECEIDEPRVVRRRRDPRERAGDTDFLACAPRSIPVRERKVSVSDVKLACDRRQCVGQQRLEQARGLSVGQTRLEPVAQGNQAIDFGDDAILCTDRRKRKDNLGECPTCKVWDAHPGKVSGENSCIEVNEHAIQKEMRVECRAWTNSMEGF